MKHILITGASGFIGKRLSRLFLQKGYEVTGIGTSHKHPFSLAFNNFSWISADTTIEGSFNFTGPESVRQKQFARALGQSLHRPSFMPAPSFFVKGIMGELGHSLFQSQKAITEKLTNSGFYFKFSNVKSALEDIFRKTDDYSGNLHDA